MDGQCLLPNTVLPSKFDGLNFDGLAGKHQNRQNFPSLKFPAIRHLNSSSEKLNVNHKQNYTFS